MQRPRFSGKTTATATLLAFVAAGCGAEMVGDVGEIQREAREVDGLRENFEGYAPGASVGEYYSGVGGAGSLAVAADDAGQARQSYKLSTGTGAAGTYNYASAKLCNGVAAAVATTRYTAAFMIKLENLARWTLIGLTSDRAYVAWWWIDETGAVYEGSGGVITTLAAGAWHHVRMVADTTENTLTLTIGNFSRTVPISSAWNTAPNEVIDCMRVRTSYTAPQAIRLDHFRGQNG